MAKTYGNRWQVIEHVASGGQGEVFSVRDLTGEHTERLALKRVLNPRRHARFRTEVDAIATLDHPNIIKVVDHSALSDDEGAVEKQFLVMPMAREDLTKRVALYKGNVDSVIQVTQQIASALQVAHAAGIVHRDVKPHNILFPGVGHDVWLSDFGICLIRECDRATAEAEVVGPVQFMAPELEQGGRLEVNEAADVYSLGKVIFYMLSGGTTLPRERLSERPYVDVFDQSSTRQRLLQILIGRMIASLPNRLSTMAKVSDELNRIARWESGPLMPAAPAAMLRIEELKRKSLAAQQKQERDTAARLTREATLELVISSVMAWCEARLRIVADLFGNGGGISSSIRRSDSTIDVRFPEHRLGPGVELWLESDAERFGYVHVLRLNFCTSFKITFTHNAGTSEIGVEQPKSEHIDVAVLPTYGRAFGRKNPPLWHYLNADGGVIQYHPPTPQSAPRSIRTAPPLRGVLPPSVKVVLLTFSTADWPSVTDSLEAMVSAAIDTFTKCMGTGRM